MSPKLTAEKSCNALKLKKQNQLYLLRSEKSEANAAQKSSLDKSLRKKGKIQRGFRLLKRLIIIR